MKRMIVASRNDEEINEFLEEFAYETCDLNEQFDESEYLEFRKSCKAVGFSVNKDDFDTYLDKVADIMGYTTSPSKNRSDKLDIAKDSDDPKVLEELASDKDKYVRGFVASNPNTPAAVLMKLAGDKDVLWELARNANTPVELLEKLAYSNSVDVRLGVASNRSTPEDILTMLSGDKNKYVRNYVAWNPSAPSDVLYNLSNSRGSYYTCVADNPSAPPEALELIFNKHSDNMIAMRSVANNPNTPRSVLAELANYDDEYVRDAVRERS